MAWIEQAMTGGRWSMEVDCRLKLVGILLLEKDIFGQIFRLRFEPGT
jgi:hypothetical protein